MLDREHVAEAVAARLPTEWQRAARIPGLRQRIVEVLRNPTNGDLHIQLDTLSRLLTHPENPGEDEWLTWAGYAFGLPAQRPGEPASATHTRTRGLGKATP